jgi:beta-lactamase class A
MKKVTFFWLTLLVSGCSPLFSNLKQPSQGISNNCPDASGYSLNSETAEPIDLTQKFQNLSGQVSRNQAVIYTFHAQAGQEVNYQTDDNICVAIYSPGNQLLTNKVMPTGGRYKLLIFTAKGSKSFSLKVGLETSNISPFQLNSKDNILVYNFRKSQEFNLSQQLQNIVDSLVKRSATQGLPTDSLSITLIDINTGKFAEYQQERLRYPASVVKLFWMVAFYAQQQAGIIQSTGESEVDMFEMINKSDNEAASRILDQITNTQSGKTTEDYETWLSKREEVNHFFEAAGYTAININQKTFPIPYLKDYGKSPQGYEQKMRGNPNSPTRNQITAKQAARLMYEIVTGQAISSEYSQKMATLLRRDLSREAWVNIDPNFEFNPIRAFLGEGLPPNVLFLSKAGWTSQTRQEVAFVQDGNTAYILAIFAEDKAYATNAKIFPEMSRFVFERLKGTTVTNVGNSPLLIPATPLKPSQRESQPQLRSSNQPHSLGWIRLGAVNNTSGTATPGERLISTNISVFISPATVPLVGDRVTVAATTAVNTRSSAPQPPDYKLANRVGSVEPGQKVVIRKVEAVKEPATSSPRTAVWAEVETP